MNDSNKESSDSSTTDLGKKIDKTNLLLEELLTIQKNMRERQKRFWSLSLIMLALYLLYFGWVYNVIP